jgi:hypothetical protein
MQDNTAHRNSVPLLMNSTFVRKTRAPWVHLQLYCSHTCIPRNASTPQDSSHLP